MNIRTTDATSGEVDHAHARHELPDRGQDRLGNLVEDGVKGVAGVDRDPGEDDPNEDRDEKDVCQDRDEQAESCDL
jgi:hypothetical protein